MHVYSSVTTRLKASLTLRIVVFSADPAGAWVGGVVHSPLPGFHQLDLLEHMVAPCCD